MSINLMVFGQLAFMGDEVAQGMTWQGEVVTHVGPTHLNLGHFSS
jgi:hypothetical protein